MTDFAFAAWCRTGLPTADASSALPSSASKAASATAPKPFADRESISRRVGLPKVNAAPPIALVQVDELFRIEQGVRQVCPRPYIVDSRLVPSRLFGDELQTRGRFIGSRRASERSQVHLPHLLQRWTRLGECPLCPDAGLFVDERIVQED